MTLPQQEPVIARVFDHTPASLHETLLQAGQRPAVDPFREHESPPQIPDVVGEHAQLQPDFVRAEPVSRQSRPMRLFAFLDPLLGYTALVIEPHDGTIGELEISP